MPPIAFVAGYPIHHSRSPLIHTHWLHQYGITGKYLPLELETEQLPQLIKQIRKGTYIGGNITLPHKVAIARHCDRLTPQATAISAVNTLYREGKKIVGHNTDATGFIANLDQQAPRWRRHVNKCLLLGAGGAARAVAFALLDDQLDNLTILNRTQQKAQTLAQHLRQLFPEKQIDARPLDHFNRKAPQTDLLVNTTSIGMNNTRFGKIDPARLAPEAVVAEIVYTPLETPLLNAAKLAGLTTVDGLGMLLHQAVPGFEKWFGHRPEVTPELRKRILADLASLFDSSTP